jgi:hypothetical protein
MSGGGRKIFGVGKADARFVTGPFGKPDEKRFQIPQGRGHGRRAQMIRAARVGLIQELFAKGLRLLDMERLERAESG